MLGWLLLKDGPAVSGGAGVVGGGTTEGRGGFDGGAQQGLAVGCAAAGALQGTAGGPGQRWLRWLRRSAEQRVRWMCGSGEVQGAIREGLRGVIEIEGGGGGVAF